MTALFLITSMGSFLFTNAQNSRVNLSNKNEQLKDVIKEIEKQTNYLFVYNTGDIDLTKETSLVVKDEPIEKVLASVFKNNNIDYQIQGNNIMLMEANALQQTDKREVSGTVLDEQGIPLIGASVAIKGTTRGNITDIDGKFKVSVAPGDVLEVSYMGYNTQDVPITTETNYVIKMQLNAVMIDDVVVTALGIKRSEKALSYNAQQVNQDELTNVKDANFINSLSGKVAGVTINSASSGVGSSSKVVMRGTKSIGKSNNALYVVDGIPMYTRNTVGDTQFGSQGGTDPIADINPEDIESLTVLNGAAASALYGSDAANGVILITTKQGKSGKTTVTFSQNTEFLSPFVLPKFQNSYGSGSSGLGDMSSDKSWGAKLYGMNRTGYEPKDYFQTGVVTTEALTLTTGTDVNQTFVSMAAVNSEGYIPNNTYDRLNFTIRNTTSLLNDKMKLDLGASYIKQKDNNMTNQGIYQNPLIPVYLFPRSGDWNDVKNYEQWDTSRNISTQRWNYGLTNYNAQNPYWINNRNLRSNTRDRFLMNIGLSYDVLSWLNISGRAKTDFTSSKYQQRLYATTNTTLTNGSSTGYYGIKNGRERQSYADILASMHTAFLEDNLTLNAVVGASISDVMTDYTETSGGLLDTQEKSSVPNVFNVMQIDKSQMYAYNEKIQDQNQAIFASVELGYKGTYYLTLTGRNEWPSQLAGFLSNKSSYFYPSVGGSVVLSQLIKMPKQIEYVKLRGSYADVASPFDRGLAQRYHLWNQSIGGYDPNYNHYPISDLDPERTGSWEIGLTARFLDGFSFDISLYTAKTYNQVFDANIAASSGYNTFYIQGGSVRNNGIELSLGYQKTFDKFTWSSNYVFTSNSNKITSLVEDWRNPIDGTPYPDDKVLLDAVGDTKFILKKGGTLGDLYSLTDLRRDDNGNVYVDENGNVSKVNIASNPVKLGSVLPKANMSWRNDFSWNNFNFGFLISARLGGIVTSTTQSALDFQGVSQITESARDNGGVLVNGGDVVDAQNWYETIGGTSNIGQYYTYNATNVRLQEISLGYTFPKAKLWNVGDLTVSLIAKNLLMIYNKAPFDPEAVATTGNNYQGVDYFMMPSNRSIGFNVKMKF